MRQWLILTTVDVLASYNNREHSVLHQLAGRFQSVCVVYRRRAGSGSAAARLRDALLPYSVCDRKGHIRFIGVNHPLNHPVGMVRAVTDSARSPRSPLHGAARHCIKLLADPIGILKDVLTIISLAGFAGWHGLRHREVFCTALGPWAAAAGLMLRTAGLVDRVLYEDRDYEPGFMADGLRRRWTRWVENACIRRSDGLIVISDRLAALRAAECGRHAAVVPTGVRLECFKHTQNGPRRPTIFYVGNVADWALLDLAVRALVTVRRRVPDARLEILGNGHGEAVPAIRSLATELGVADAISILPPRRHEEVAAFLSQAAIGYAMFSRVPLRIYASPLKVIEYMAAGLPVLTTRGTEAGDLVEHHGAGFAVEPTEEAVTASLLELLENRELSDSLGARGLRAAAGYEWQGLMEREWQVMQATVHAKGAARPAR